ncbi:TonB-dependent receptor [Flavobacteriales bacterium]|jgi:Fe(3+) dicitrate transport protein|nr:TonB-dependent receptor [Flavobacteriales bacterium]
MTKFLSILFLLASLFVVANGGDESALRYNVKGRLLFEGTTEPVISAMIGFEKDGHFNYEFTDEFGQFGLIDLPLGKIQLQVSYLVCESSYEIEIIAENQEDVTLFMKDCSVMLDPVPIIGDRQIVQKKQTGTGTVLSVERLEMSNPMGTQEALEMTPGVHGFSDDGAGNSRQSIGIRGLNPRRSSRVLILEDGIPIQPALYIYPNMYYNPPIERISTVEVVKGSGAILHGPQTMGGVINYVTRRPRSEFGGLVQVTGGNNTYLSNYVEIGGFGNKKISPEFQMLYKKGDGFRDNNAFEQLNGTFKLNYHFDDKTTWYLKFNVNQETSNATYTGLTEYNFENSPFFNPKEHDQFDVFRTSLDAIRNRQISKNINDVTKVYVNYFTRDWWRENDVFITAEDFLDGDNQQTAVPWYTDGDLMRVGNGRDNFGILRTFYVGGVEKAYHIKHGKKAVKGNLTIGGRFHMERFEDHKKQGFAVDDREGKYFVIKGIDEEWDTWNEWTGETDSIAILGQAHNYETMALSFFMQDELKWKKWIFTPGVRAELFEQKRLDLLRGASHQDNALGVLLPGFGLNYQIGNTNLFGGVHRGFTPPSSGALKVLNFGSNVGLDLEAEQSWNVELGYRGFKKALRWEVAVFNMDIENMVAAGRGTAFKNLGRVNSRGVELAAVLESSLFESKIGKWLPSGRITYTFLNTEVIDGIIASSQSTGDVSIAGNELPYAPNHTFVIGLNKKIKDFLKVGLELKSVSSVFTDFENVSQLENRGDQGKVPSYHLINFNLMYDVSNQWRIQLSVKNLLNEVYIGSRLHSNPGQPEANLSSGIMPGASRQVNIGIKYKFGK